MTCYIIFYMSSFFGCWLTGISHDSPDSAHPSTIILSVSDCLVQSLFALLSVHQFFISNEHNLQHQLLKTIHIYSLVDYVTTGSDIVHWLLDGFSHYGQHLSLHFASLFMYGIVSSVLYIIHTIYFYLIPPYS